MIPKAAVRPPNHGIYLHDDHPGAPGISVTKASATGRHQPSRRLSTLRGLERDIAYPHLAAILRNEEDINLVGQHGEYHPIDETTASHLQLAMMAVRETDDTAQAQHLGQIVAEMHNAEARWWYAHYRDRKRPKNIIGAIALVWG